MPGNQRAKGHIGYIGHVVGGRYGRQKIEFDAAGFLENLFCVPAATAATAAEGSDAVSTPPTEAADAAADPLAGTPCAGWMLRPDWRGRLGWERPDLPEEWRWWARGDWEDLPKPIRAPRGGDSNKPAPRIAPGCVAGGMVDTLDPSHKRPVQGHLQGLGGA